MLVENRRFEPTTPLFGAQFKVISLECRRNFWPRRTRVLGYRTALLMGSYV